MTRTMMANKTAAVCSHLICQGELNHIRNRPQANMSYVMWFQALASHRIAFSLKDPRDTAVAVEQLPGEAHTCIPVCLILFLRTSICSDPMLKIYGKTSARKLSSMPTDLLSLCSPRPNPLISSLVLQQITSSRFPSPLSTLLWSTQTIPF